MAKIDYESIILDKYYPKESFQSQYIDNKVIPWPFTKFGKSIDNLLHERGLSLIKKDFEFEGNQGGLRRVYSNENRIIKIEYNHEVEFVEDYFIDYNGSSINSLKRGLEEVKNLKISPEEFYDLYTNDKIGSDFITIKYENSELALIRFRGKLFTTSLINSMEEKDINKFLLKKRTSKYSYADNTYITQENVLNYLSDIVPNLKKDFNPH